MTWMIWLLVAVAVAVAGYWLLRPLSPSPLPQEEPYEHEVDGEIGPCILFLDFDGVLHPGNSGTFSKMAVLLDFLAERPHWQIVVTSDWRISHRLAGVRALFPAHVRARVVGTTPYFQEKLRSLEVQAFVDKYGVQDYLILDDNAALFASDIPQLVLIPNETGLEPAHYQALLART